VVSIQLWHEESEEPEDLVTELLPSNGHLHGSSLSAIFWLSGVMSRICLYDNVMAASAGSTILVSRGWGDTETHR
jgi:hypothetical protein